MCPNHPLAPSLTEARSHSLEVSGGFCFGCTLGAHDLHVGRLLEGELLSNDSTVHNNEEIALTFAWYMACAFEMDKLSVIVSTHVRFGTRHVRSYTINKKKKEEHTIKPLDVSCAVCSVHSTQFHPVTMSESNCSFRKHIHDTESSYATHAHR